MSEEQRIYVVVAETVQNPLYYKQALSKTRWLVVPGEQSKTIVQPIGRIGAQIAHVVSKMRLHNVKKHSDDPITTIILSVPDSFQLCFIEYLLTNKLGFAKVFHFKDDNEEAYGPGSVMTAICTVPVNPIDVEGVLDYLPLWGR